MPDVFQSSLAVLAFQGQVTTGYLRQIVLVGTVEFPLFVESGRDDVEGSPSPPSLKQGRYGFLNKLVKWNVKAGTRTFSIDVKYNSDTVDPNAAPRAKVIIKANPDIGVNSDVEGEAPAGSGFQTIGPLTVTPTSDGVLEVRLVVQSKEMSGRTWWDNIQRT